ncbi:MAG: hypothetical protein MUO72_17595 [Bacteroidales bacterium]|nr:hypothetical protein [Bacteroidales bacterium]
MLINYFEDSISNITPFRLEDILIIDDFIMIVGLDMLTIEELGRNEYLVNNAGCSFKLMDFDFLKNILNKMDGKMIGLKMD